MLLNSLENLPKEVTEGTCDPFKMFPLANNLYSNYTVAKNLKLYSQKTTCKLYIKPENSSFLDTIKIYNIDLNGYYQIRSLLVHKLQVVAQISMYLTIMVEKCHVLHFWCPLLSSKKSPSEAECFIELGS